MTDVVERNEPGAGLFLQGGLLGLLVAFNRSPHGRLAYGEVLDENIIESHVQEGQR